MRRSGLLCLFPMLAGTFVAAAGAAGVLAACSHEWTLGPAPPSEAAGGGDGGSPEDGAAPNDAPSTSDAPPTCAELLAALPQARAAAHTCVTNGSFCAPVTDECGCAGYVGDSNSAAAQGYLAVVRQLRGQACAVACSTCSTSGSSVCAETTPGQLRCFP